MTLILLFIVSIPLFFLNFFWKTIEGILNLRKFDYKIPGPPTSPILGNVQTFRNKSTVELNQIFLDAAEKCRNSKSNYMKYRILDKLFVLPLDGKSAAKILESSSELNKGDDYDFFEPWLGGGILVGRGGEKWRTHRKLLTPSFHFAKLEGYLEVFNTESRILVSCLDEFSDSPNPIDIFPFIKRCALDIICSAVMGTKVDAQFDHNHPYVNAVEEFSVLVIQNAINPIFQIPPLFWLLGYQKQKEECIKVMKEFSMNVISERKAALDSGEIEKETRKRKMNFLDILLKESSLSSEDVRQEVDTFMFAGHDTTTSSVSWACWNLAENPEVQEKVYKELVEVFGEDEDVTYEKMSKLEYTERVLKESKRLVAPVPMVQRKLISDLEIDGVTIPAGANISISPMLIHKNPEVYPNPEKFDPDRFLPDEISKRNAFDYIPFSAGLRNCIGQKFAQINEKVMIANILRNFRLEPCGVTKPALEPIARPSNGVPVKLIRR
ncbi:hypothetical protein B9Z55_021404 [Caenorhabditis nigoni]|uniref:Cytochrome P450 n=1 Tax=Caenorhabditis nigoni TaxID=1611254 RepID=A0A2G5TSF6_9PELO|nr:hypothetical protein B9Z55_021404 [Caenorhabditis nigoni]